MEGERSQDEKNRRFFSSWLLSPSIETWILFINLGFLQFAAVVGVDDFPFGEDIQAGEAGFAVAVAGAACAAEGELDFGSGGAGIDVQDASGDITYGALDAVVVLRVDGTGEAEGSVVID